VFAFLPALALTVALVVLSACTAAALREFERLGRAFGGGGRPDLFARTIGVGLGVTGSLPTIAVVKVTPIPNAPDSRTVVKVVAADVRWVPTTLAAPAGQVWHVTIDNQDGPPEHHNFVVASGKTVPERIYQSTNFNKGTFTFDVPALPAGNYLFICTVHADVMTGTLELR
jgi:plastocyanin